MTPVTRGNGDKRSLRCSAGQAVLDLLRVIGNEEKKKLLTR